MKLAVRVHPGARREGLIGRMADGTLKLAVSAAPEGGRANEAVVALLAGALGIGRRQVAVVRGQAARAKWVEVEGLDPDELTRRLDAALRGSDATHGGH